MDKMKNEKGTNGHKEVENLGAQDWRALVRSEGFRFRGWSGWERFF